MRLILLSAALLAGCAATYAPPTVDADYRPGSVPERDLAAKILTVVS